MLALFLDGPYGKKNKNKHTQKKGRAVAGGQKDSPRRQRAGVACRERRGGRATEEDLARVQCLGPQQRARGRKNLRRCGPLLLSAKCSLAPAPASAGREVSSTTGRSFDGPYELNTYKKPMALSGREDELLAWVAALSVELDAALGLASLVNGLLCRVYSLEGGQGGASPDGASATAADEVGVGSLCGVVASGAPHCCHSREGSNGHASDRSRYPGGGVGRPSSDPDRGASGGLVGPREQRRGRQLRFSRNNHA